MISRSLSHRNHCINLKNYRYIKDIPGIKGPLSIVACLRFGTVNCPPRVEQCFDVNELILGTKKILSALSRCKPLNIITVLRLALMKFRPKNILHNPRTLKSAFNADFQSQSLNKYQFTHRFGHLRHGTINPETSFQTQKYCFVYYMQNWQQEEK